MGPCNLYSSNSVLAGRLSHGELDGWMVGVYGICEIEMRELYVILEGKPECEM